MKKYFIYILTNSTNSVLYIGFTSNLSQRIYQHKNKLVSGFTEKYNTNKLVYYEIFDDPENGIKREKTLKNLLRKKKNELVNKFNPGWRDLYLDILD